MLWIMCVLKNTEVMLILQMILFSNAAHEMGKLTFPIKNLKLKVKC